MTEPGPESPTTAEREIHQELARAVGELTAGGPPSRSQVRDLVQLSARSAKEAGTQAVTSGRWLADVVIEAAGHLTVRDLDTLRAHHRGKDGPELAEAVVRNATRMSAAVGAATGAVIAASQITPATWTVLPIELLAETLIVASVELKLVAELAAIARQPLNGSITERGQAAARVWAENQGVRPGRRMRGDLGLLGRQARAQLTSQMQKLLLRRAGRNLWSLLPFLIGAIAGGELNRRATQRVGERVSMAYGLRGR
jgi:hypothetical protein